MYGMLILMPSSFEIGFMALRLNIGINRQTISSLNGGNRAEQNASGRLTNQSLTTMVVMMFLNYKTYLKIQVENHISAFSQFDSPRNWA